MNRHFLAYACVLILVVLLATIYVVYNRPPVPHAATGQFTPVKISTPNDSLAPMSTSSSQPKATPTHTPPEKAIN